MTKVIMRMKMYVFLDILTILHKVGIGTRGTKILLKCNSSTSLHRLSPYPEWSLITTGSHILVDIPGVDAAIEARRDQELGVAAILDIFDPITVAT